MKISLVMTTSIILQFGTAELVKHAKSVIIMMWINQILQVY